MLSEDAPKKFSKLLTSLRPLLSIASHATLWWPDSFGNLCPADCNPGITKGHRYSDGIEARLTVFREGEFEIFCELATEACYAAELKPSNAADPPWWTWIRYVFDVGRELGFVQQTQMPKGTLEALTVPVCEAFRLVIEHLLRPPQTLPDDSGSSPAETEDSQQTETLVEPFCLERFPVLHQRKEFQFVTAGYERWGPVKFSEGWLPLEDAPEWYGWEALYHRPGGTYWLRISIKHHFEAGCFGPAECEYLTESEAAQWFVSHGTELPDDLQHLRESHTLPDAPPELPPVPPSEPEQILVHASDGKRYAVPRSDIQREWHEPTFTGEMVALLESGVWIQYQSGPPSFSCETGTVLSPDEAINWFLENLGYIPSELRETEAAQRLRLPQSPMQTKQVPSAEEQPAEANRQAQSEQRIPSGGSFTAIDCEVTNGEAGAQRETDNNSEAKQESPDAGSMEANIQKALDFIRENKPTKWLPVAKHLGIKLTTLTRHYAPELKQRGVKKDKNGRYVAGAE